MSALRQRIVCFSIALVAALGLGCLSTQAAMSIYLSPEELAIRASRIVEAEVVATRSGWDPQTGALSTYVTLQVTADHLESRGDTGERTPESRSRSGSTLLTLREPGGQFGDLVHEVDAVPIYAVGEQVFVFLEPAPDGALRTSGMFFGKYTLDPKTDAAVRKLSGQGRILHRPDDGGERTKKNDLIAVAAAAKPDPGRRGTGRKAPPEMERLVFDDAAPAHATHKRTAEGHEKFVALSSTHPTRWDRVDSGIPVLFDIERARTPLGSGIATVAEIQRAMDAWTDVPESRVVLQASNTNAQFTPAHPNSPAVVPPGGANVILFGDPYDDISDSGVCSGILAIGGYWRSAQPTTSVNGVTFYPAQYGYVIFNDGLDCFLGNANNLAEVAAHELGHTLGFGHSPAFDSLMRASAYGGRGPRLGDDDRDGAHCHYPHTLSLQAPLGGESWEAGNVRTINWQSTFEAGVDAGTVDLEYQVDGGPWVSIAQGTANDGSFAWPVPDVDTANARVRVLRTNRTTPFPATFPEACSVSAPSANFQITGLPPVPGQIVASSPGSGLLLDKSGADNGGALAMQWSASCSGEADGYAVYEADLDALRHGRFNPQPLSCDTGNDRAEELIPSSGNRFFLIAPLAGGIEGGYGSGTLASRAAPSVRCGSPAEPSAQVCE